MDEWKAHQASNIVSAVYVRPKYYFPTVCIFVSFSTLLQAKVADKTDKFQET